MPICPKCENEFEEPKAPRVYPTIKSYGYEITIWEEKSAEFVNQREFIARLDNKEGTPKVLGPLNIEDLLCYLNERLKKTDVELIRAWAQE